MLGGNTLPRAEVAFALWQRHRAPILVTGDQDLIRDELIKLGVPESEIIHEPSAWTTWENAVLTRKFLEARGTQSAALVTSWFHTSRARECFMLAMPEVRFQAYSDAVPEKRTFDDEKVVATERLKKLHYWAVYSIFPW